ncbi:MAG: hypothetical protein GF350_02755 [Chitinivibrionales bacterium]|nr:hypothetical protein [Chitinivibrionales bacterium]
MHILYYITAHGYGHGVRACTIANAFSDSVRVTFRTCLPEPFFAEEMDRPFSYYPGQFDCGCFQRDFVTIDMQKTIAAYAEIDRRNERILGREVAWCKENHVTGIVADIPPFAFEVAARADVPSVAATNFTWHTIYAPFADRFPEFSPYVEKIKYQYSLADCLLDISPASPMESFRKRISMPVVGRKGQDRRAAIAQAFGLQHDRKLALIYIGEYGMEDANWKNLERFDQWDFFGVSSLPGAPRNYHTIDKHVFAYQDFSASSDLVISKIGYSTVAECMVNGVPLLYLPRTDFAEYPALENAVRSWGGGHCLDAARYRNFEWDTVLARAFYRKKPYPADCTGALQCAATIEALLASGKNALVA